MCCPFVDYTLSRNGTDWVGASDSSLRPGGGDRNVDSYERDGDGGLGEQDDGGEHSCEDRGVTRAWQILLMAKARDGGTSRALSQLVRFIGKDIGPCGVLFVGQRVALLPLEQHVRRNGGRGDDDGGLPERGVKRGGG